MNVRVVRSMGWRFVMLAWALLVSASGSAYAQSNTAGAADVDTVALGRSIYERGIGQSGVPVNGLRDGKTLSGASVACINCHRSSGLGQVEADILIPPIAGNFLYAKPAEKRLVNMDPRVSKFFNQAHEPYTNVSLAAAIREGTNNDGRSMSTVMPRFALNDVEMPALAAYLKQLSVEWSAGVTAGHIHLATVITPEVDAPRRQAFISMMQAIVRQKNGSTVLTTADQKRTRHHMVSAAELMLGTERTWDLDIWELQGTSDTWAAQLQARYQQNPPFAIVSGLGAGNWQPVHDFCDHAHVPCWFPSVLLPGASEPSQSLYFSGGVALEAAILAKHLTSQIKLPKHLIQITRDDFAGAAAAQNLKTNLAGTGIDVQVRVLPIGVALDNALPPLLKGLGRDSVVMFWLPAQDIASLAAVKPGGHTSYFSALMGRAVEFPLPEAWKRSALWVYPYELPDQRMRNLDYFNIWMASRKLPIVDLAMQSEVYFAMGFLTDTLSDMMDNLYRDYLIERAETMLSQREGAKSEQETRDRVFLGRAGDLEKKHGEKTIDAATRIAIPEKAEGNAASHGTTLYSHLSLAAGQRFASKGGYIVSQGEGTAVNAVSPMIFP